MNEFDPHDVTHIHQGNTPAERQAALEERRERIGRYRIERLLGKGGFGLVYLAHDEQLHRLVAIKVPHSSHIDLPEDAEAYLAEARTVANLDHPHIIPVFDVGSTEDCPCFVVSKYIEGSDLAKRIRESRLNYRESAQLIATVAEALHYAHKRGLVHRDVKPGNILIDKDGTAFVVDFGLALREENIGHGPKCAGTPSYMSPEQARGEGHRVDGRSDVFSLGVVFYELLTGRKPFRADTQAELFEQVTSFDPKPLRQFDEKLPKELERICLKAMAKRASERYSSAYDMAEDLRLFLQEQSEVVGNSPKGVAESTLETPTPVPQTLSVGSRTGTSASEDLGTSDSFPVRIVPKGLRSFDSHDADFFLELLPGPRDRNGLPDSLRFWKTRIEETDSDNTFSVGMIYGPSGCGKSSLVKAGLLPRLSTDVIPIYIEATPDETETRLLNGLRKRCPMLDESLGLKDSLASLRRGQGLPAGKKVVIIIDQFEQWLHAKKEEDTELVNALRQCDGGRVQCVVMVRDDFWLAVSRFLRELEIRLIEGQNSALTDLFDLDHARKVLGAFGRAFGKLPERMSDKSAEQKEFLTQAVSGLAEEGKVICVRLALFAEMMKGKAWTSRTLQEVGGTRGIGVTFLEETFSASTAPPEHRIHQQAARTVLKHLLPDSGTDIKGCMRTRAELLEASGYINQPREFDDLIRILDSELRLITPTDPDGKSINDDSVSSCPTGQKYFQLTHDYLVPALRNWLNRKQQETRHGRAELKLFDTAQVWNAKPENRFLPSWWEHLTIRLFTDKNQWTEPQRRMMARAWQVHGIRSIFVCSMLVAVAFGGLTIRSAVNNRQRDVEATQLVEGFLQADTSQVKTILGKLPEYRPYTADDLKSAFADSPDDSIAKLHAALALLPEDASVLPFLKERLLTVSPVQFSVVRDELAAHQSDLIPEYWEIANDTEQQTARRFQAACALATFDSDSDHWQNKQFQSFVAEHLVGVLPSELLPWRNALRPVKTHLTEPLAAIYRDDTRDTQTRGFATDALADYLSDDAEQLFDLVADANEKQFTPMFNRLASHKELALALAIGEVSKTPADDTGENEKELLAIRRANAAVILLRLNSAENIWPLLRHSSDPRVRSYIIHWLSHRGGDAQTIIARFEQETDVTIKRALLQCLGEFDVAESDQRALSQQLLELYRTHPDAGLHASAEWLLRKWKQDSELAAIDETLRLNEEQLASDSERQWYINGQGQTFAILDAGEFLMGSPDSEIGRNSNEPLHRRSIGRRLAMSTKEVTVKQWERFVKSLNKPESISTREKVKSYIYTEDSPMLSMSWYEAAWYCNWLSEQEGISPDQWCYEPNESGKYVPGMKAKEEFWTLTGYRLPTEAEWEFSCRAGAETTRFYGVSDSLLPHYAWFQANGQNRTWPVGRLKPNDFGLFDTQGSAIEWLYDPYNDYPTDLNEAYADAPNTDAVTESSRRVLRGGSFTDLALYVRSADRTFNQPINHIYFGGFRPARTYLPGEK